MRRSLAWSVLGLGLFLMSAGCTRKVDTNKFNVRIPVPQKVGSLIAYNLDIAIVNVHIPGQPTRIVKRENHGQNKATIAPGTEVVLEVTNVPPGQSALVQVLAVYSSDSTGAMKFYYGDQSVQTGSTADVYINATESGVSSGKEAQIFGRYLTTASSGPTGTLEMLFEIGNGKPPMTVEKGIILNGWFQAFAVEGAKFDLRVAETGVTLFDDLSLDDATGDLLKSVAGVPTPINFNVGYRMRMLKPLSFRPENNGAEPQPESYLILGYFDNSNDSLVSSKLVVYPNVIEGLNGTFTNPTLTTVMNYDPSGGIADITHIDGGSAVTTAEAFLRNTAVTGCYPADVAAGNCLFFHHTKFSNGREGFSGIEIPFETLRPSSMSSDIAISSFKKAGCSGSDCIQLKWKLLPGTAPLLQDVEVWMKQYTSGGDEGGGDKRCGDDLKAMGYSVVGNVAPGSAGFDYLNAGLTSNNSRQFRFYLCARSIAAGNPYVSRPINVSCGDASCNRWNHLGWAPTGTQSITSPTGTSVSRRVYANVSAANPLATYFQTATPSGFAVNDELLISVVGANGTNSCGVYAGDSSNPIKPGAFAFGRILNIVSSGGGSGIYLEKGTFLDDLANSGITNTELQAAGTAGGTFCFATATKVNHYNDLTFSSIGNLSPPSFSYSSTTGGILAVRVNGTLTMGNGTYFDAAGKGFPGGTGMANGAGTTGDLAGVSVPNLAGAGASYGGGGGGYGRGGMQTGFGAGGSGESSYSNGMLRLMMGGGGGGGNASNGAAGGGAIFLVANKINVPSGATAYLKAYGGTATLGGGGGGGSIFALARLITGGGNLVLTADGGDAAAASGGIGGGGSVDRLMCVNDTLSPVTLSSSAAKGSVGSNDSVGTPAQDGMSNNIDPTANSWLCRMQH